MPIKYSYDKDHKIVFVNPVEIINMQDIKEYFFSLLNSESIKNGFIEVIDLERVDNFTIDIDDCLELSKIVKRLKQEKSYGGAVIYSPDTMAFTIAKLLSEVLKLAGISNISFTHDKTNIEIKIKELRSQ